MKTPVPGPKGYPLIGVMPQLAKYGAVFFQQSFETFGDVVMFKLLGSLRMFLISHPDHVEQVLQRNNKNYLMLRPSLHIKGLMGNGLTLSNGDLWLKQRRMMHPIFQREKLGDMVSLNVAHIVSMLHEWQHKPEFDIVEEMEKVVLNITLSTIFGADLSEGDKKTFRDAVIFWLQVGGRGMFMEVPPVIPTPENIRLRRALNRIKKMVHAMIAERHAHPKPGASDLLSLLIAARDADSNEGMTDQQLVDEVFSILIPGYETAAVALSWLFYTLALHPEVATKVQHELDEALQGKVPSFSDLEHLEYTNQVIKESLRLHSPFWAMTRQTIADDEIGGYHIPAGSIVVVSSYVTHKHPSFWPNPNAFIPERFSAENTEKHHRCAYFPFGRGPRICVAEPQGMLNLQMITILVMQHFSLRLANPLEKVKLRTALTVRPAAGLRMLVERRKTDFELPACSPSAANDTFLDAAKCPFH